MAAEALQIQALLLGGAVRVWGFLGFRVEGLGFRGALGFGVEDLGLAWAQLNRLES